MGQTESLMIRFLKMFSLVGSKLLQALHKKLFTTPWDSHLSYLISHPAVAGSVGAFTFLARTSLLLKIVGTFYRNIPIQNSNPHQLGWRVTCTCMYHSLQFNLVASWPPNRQICFLFREKKKYNKRFPRFLGQQLNESYLRFCRIHASGNWRGARIKKKKKKVGTEGKYSLKATPR